jgi:hypothetical protein
MDLINYLEMPKSSNTYWATRIERYNNVGSSTIQAYSYIIGGLRILHPNTIENCRVYR